MFLFINIKFYWILADEIDIAVPNFVESIEILLSLFRIWVKTAFTSCNSFTTSLLLFFSGVEVSPVNPRLVKAPITGKAINPAKDTAPKPAAKKAEPKKEVKAAAKKAPVPNTGAI